MKCKDLTMTELLIQNFVIFNEWTVVCKLPMNKDVNSVSNLVSTMKGMLTSCSDPVHPHLLSYSLSDGSYQLLSISQFPLPYLSKSVRGPLFTHCTVPSV